MKSNLANLNVGTARNHQALFTKNIVTHVRNGEAKQTLLKNKLIYTKNAVLQKPLVPWANELITKLRTIEKSGNKTNGPLIASIYHQAAHIYMFMNDMASAREICYSQIQMFINRSNDLQHDELMRYVFRPWINLIRIDCVEENFTEALHKLEILNLKNERIENRVADFSRATLYNRIYLDRHLKQYLFDAFLQETFLIYLASKNYHGLFNFIKLVNFASKCLYQPLLQESLIIALANIGRIADAFQLLTFAQSVFPLGIAAIFRLRECELMLALNEECKTIFSLYKLAERYLCKKRIHVRDIIFGLHAVRQLQANSLLSEAARLSYFCLRAAQQIGDQFLTAESLVLLYELIKHTEGREIIENLMIEHYFNTQYQITRQVLINSFKDLEYVEAKKEQALTSLLFEELLIFASRVSF